ncbi:hypothetical protein I7I53_04100 [Histoplasma capsulatum var. duboisii H88]|uniref:Uncharacterized protein n=1 Tax=Ajellomyces capsulatus (strain H88) TaxID=544711 RepID=A0A8A1LQE2_AJEC8|nr:hypothetical protein I7I53_04100 [Histoplasma capsulatum var. duboisii H88]
MPITPRCSNAFTVSGVSIIYGSFLVDICVVDCVKVPVVDYLYYHFIHPEMYKVGSSEIHFLEHG